MSENEPITLPLSDPRLLWDLGMLTEDRGEDEDAALVRLAEQLERRLGPGVLRPRQLEWTCPAEDCGGVLDFSVEVSLGPVLTCNKCGRRYRAALETLRPDEG